MIIKSITPGGLRLMRDQEALIMQDCGGDPTEWVDGINDILTEEATLKNRFRFEKVNTFQNEDLSCLMFPLQGESKMNVGKFAMWRLATHHNFAGQWLSAYAENRLGGFTRDQPFQQSSGKPDCPLIR